MADRLENLLRAADQRSPAPALNPADLAATAWKTAKRRGRNAMALKTVAAIGLTASLWIALPHWISGASQSAPSSNSVARLPTSSELADLETRIATQEKLVAHLDAVNRLQRAHARRAELRSESDFNPLDEAAVVVMIEADRLRDAGLPAQATSAYEQILRYFPATSWAKPIRDRLDSLDSKG